MTCDCNKSKTNENEGCPDGQHKVDGKCVPIQEQGCPEGQHMVDGKCVPKTEEQLGGGPTDQTAGAQVTKPAENPCGEGMKLDGDGNCVPQDNKPDGVPNGTSDFTTTTEYNGPNKDEIHKREKELKLQIEEAKERINKLEQVKELDQASLNDKMYRVAKLGATPKGTFEGKDIQYIAKEAVQSLKKFGHYSFDIDLSPEWIREHANRQRNASVKEAVSFSGTQDLTIAADPEVFVLPGGKYLKSIRDLVKFKEIPKGADTAKWYKGDIPNNGTVTEGSNTSASTHTVTTVTLSADTVTGVYQTVKGADIEDLPGELLDYLAQTARAEVLESEATLVFTTAAAAATPGLWLNANSGATITHTDIASMTMEPTSLAVALQHLETQGYDTSFGNAYACLHPKALRELRVSTKLTNLVQHGDANITKTGRLTHLYGIELIPMTALDTDDNTTSDVHNNVVGIKNHTFALASKRELTIDLQKKAISSSFDWAWSQRKNATTFDATSFVRISSAQ